MTVEEIIHQVTEICKKNHVDHLSLFGSYAKGTQTKYSDLDFIIYGKVDIEYLQEQVDEIMTLKKIDLFEYDQSINRYRSYCRSLNNLAEAKGKDPKDIFILSGTVQMFNLSLDLSWKVMKDLLTEYHGTPDYPTGSPRETLRMAHSVGLIEDDTWMEMLKARNNLAHDYDGELAVKYFGDITSKYYHLLNCFKMKAAEYYK